MRPSTYDKAPETAIPRCEGEAWRGWAEVLGALRGALDLLRASRSRAIVAVECATGLLPEVRERLAAGLGADAWFDAEEAWVTSEVWEERLEPYRRDPVFGFLSPLGPEALLDPGATSDLTQRIAHTPGLSVLFGTGASQILAPDLLVYADLPRWEGQLRQRAGRVDNLGVKNAGTKPSVMYRQAYCVDWRVVDRIKAATLPRWHFLLDTTREGDPRLVTGGALRKGLDLVAHRPFRLVPLFDPAPWGGTWMRDVCGLDPQVGNYGWCFDCVPEENSLVLNFGTVPVAMPALNLVFHQPMALLGPEVFQRFGAEFPIRFDFLDTMGGGNLSLQVHPQADYMRKTFGLAYTQDESYYLLDARPEASVYLGLKEDVEPAAMLRELEEAEAGGAPFDPERHVNRWAAQRHDHFLIPAGTIHCSGAGAMVLEISATPYLFTFKLWDWGRLGLDGRPRPISLRHGAANLQWDRRTAWVRDNLVDRIEPLDEGPGWREERTGLHALEFIETRRHWFTGPVAHHTRNTVQVLNLVQGEEALVESPTDAFPPFLVHYAETFIVPAAAGAYRISPHGPALGHTCATLKAYVRS